MALPLRDDERDRHVPWVTIALIAINVVVFLFLQPSGFQVEGYAQEQSTQWRITERDEFSYRWGSVPCEIVAGKALAERPEACKDDDSAPTYPPEGKVVLLALLSCMFLHGSIAHLGGNMLFLWVFGGKVEDRLGRLNFALLYLFGGVVATLGFVATNQGSATPLIGASGAIAVAMGAYLVLLPRGRILTVIVTGAFQVVYVPAAVVLLLFFVTQFFTSQDDVAWQAHAAGMVVGAAAALVLARIPSVRRRAQVDAADAALRAGVEF